MIRSSIGPHVGVFELASRYRPRKRAGKGGVRLGPGNGHARGGGTGDKGGKRRD